MKQYKSKDFTHKQQNDTMLWESVDGKFTITSTTNQWSEFFVYANTVDGMEWTEIQTDNLHDAIVKLNSLIDSNEIEKFLYL